jgi:hypothetical protein
MLQSRGLTHYKGFFMHRIQKLCLKFFFSVACLATSIATAACPTSPVDISTTSPLPVQADQAQIGMDANGNAVAIWREYDGTDTFIMSATLLVNGSWSSPMLVTTIFGVDDLGATPQIAVNATNGDAFAIWVENDLTIKSSTLPFGGTWSSPHKLSAISVTSSLGGPQIAVNLSTPSNYAVAVWVANTGSNDFIQSAYYQAGVWSLPSNVLPSTTNELRFPQVGIDNSGIAIAVWQNNTTLKIQGATLPLAGSVWSAAADIGAADSSDVYGPRLAVGSSNYAVVAWHIFNLGIIDLRYSIFTGTWSAETSLVSSDSGTVAVAMDQAQNAMIIWRQNLGGLVIRAAYLPFGGGVTINTVSTPGGSSVFPDVAFDIAGNAYATWTKFNPTAFIQSSTLPFGAGSWSTPSCNVSSLAQTSRNSHIASFPTDYAVLDWPNATTITIQSSTLLPAPFVASINPTSGSISGGNTVIISGTNLNNLISVEFGLGNFATNITPISATEILVVVPPGLALGVVDVIVTTTGGTFTLNNAYTYLSAICWQR